jgi:hemolysin III
MNKANQSYYTESEEKLNVFTHAIGIVMSMIGLILLIQKAIDYDEVNYLVSFIIFGTSMLLLYTASTLYHSSRNLKTRSKLKILDHMAIFVLIAGTYTPFTMVTLEGSLGWIMFGITWGFAFIGILFKLFFTGRFKIVSTFAYVAMGWIVVFVARPVAENLAIEGIYWLITGGVAYTVGAILYNLTKLDFNHAIFHVFVLLGSTFHFIAVYYYV